MARVAEVALAAQRSALIATIPAVGLLYRAGASVRTAFGLDADEARSAARRGTTQYTRDTLARLKGGAQKAGQLLATLDALLPQDPDDRWQEAVDSLTERGSPISFDVIEPVLRAELGSRWWTRYRLVDEPVAAASLGQVYRATDPAGHSVAVKVQYPGIAAQVAADLTAFGAACRVAGLVAPGTSLPPLVAELRHRLIEELDYIHEADATRTFARAFADDAEVVVPDVVEATPRVLVTQWLEAEPLVTFAATAPAEARNLIGLQYQRFMLGAPARCGLLHTDPHPGNFRVLTDGRLGVLDFGSTLPMPGGLPSTFGQLIAALRDRDDAVVERALRAHGLIRPGAAVDVGRLRTYLEPFVQPARTAEFTYSPEWLRSTFGRIDDPRDPDFAVAMSLNIAPEHLFTHRVWLGVLGVLCRLRATVPVQAELDRLLPGFSDP